MTDTALPGLRERKKAQTRDAIVAAAIDLFERQGYDATTVEQIADAADVSPRTFFRYFDSKIDVIMSNKDEDDPKEFASRLSARPAEESPVEAMRQVMVEELSTTVQDNPLFVRQMRLMMRTPTLSSVAREHFNEHQAEMVCDVASRLGLAEDDLQAHVIASALCNAIWTIVGRWVAEDSSPERLVEMINDGCALLSAGLDPRS